MQVIRNGEMLETFLSDAKGELGLVPTMGALHTGHMALVDAARKKCDVVAATIFVNPTQFNDKADYQGYPKREKQDVALLKAHGCDMVFMPEIDFFYPDGHKTRVMVDDISQPLCGKNRPGHFDGVATIVTKLLGLFLPQHAFFGEKDYQQLLIIRKLVDDLFLPVMVHGVATKRDKNGLALSSRNLLLSPQGQEKAAMIYSVLCDSKKQLFAEKSPEVVLEQGKNKLIDAGFEIDYFEMRHRQTLELQTASDAHSRLFIAAKLENIRLIDNLGLNV